MDYRPREHILNKNTTTHNFLLPAYKGTPHNIYSFIEIFLLAKIRNNLSSYLDVIRFGFCAKSWP